MQNASDKSIFLPAFTLSAAVVGITSFVCLPLTAQAQQGQAQVEQESENKLEPSDIFYQAHVRFNNGEKALEKKQFLKAWEDYSAALKYYQTLKIAHKLWKPGVVDYKIKQTNKKLEDIRPQVKEEVATNNKAKEGLFNSENIDLDALGAPSELIAYSNKIKILQSQLTSREEHYKKESEKEKAQLLKLEGDLRAWKQKNQKNPKIVANIEQEIKKSEAALKNAEIYRNSDIQKIKSNITNLNKELLKNSDAPLKADLANSRKKLAQSNHDLKVVSIAFKRAQAEKVAADKKLKTTISELESTKKENQRLSSLISEQQNISTKTVKALHQKLKESEAREKSLAADLKEAKTLLAEVSGKLDQQIAHNERLQDQLEVVTAEKDRLTDLMLSNKDERFTKVIAQNLSLITELKESKDKLRIVLSAQADNISATRKAETELAVAKKRLLDFQSQSVKDNKRIRELQQQLLNEHKTSTNKIASGSLSPEALQENTILRDTAKKLLKRQLNEQKKLKLLKMQMLAENPGPELKALIDNNLTSDNLAITAREKEIIEKVDLVDGEINPLDRKLSAAETRSSIARATEQVNTIHRVAEDMVVRNRLAAARDLLEHANEIKPNNFPTLMNLGAVSMKMQDLDKSEQYFEDGIVMEQNSPYAHYMLGFCFFKKGQKDLAEKSIKHSLKLDSTQAKAKVLLGIIAGENGRLTQSNDHFKGALRIYPELAEAYFGLSINALQNEEIGKAQDYYQEALRKGLAANPAHAKKLGVPH